VGKQDGRTTEVFRSLGKSRILEAIAPGKNKVIYLLAHLLVIHDSIFETMELGKRAYTDYDELFLTPQHTANQYPSYKLLMDQWVSMNETLTFRLRHMSLDQWGTKHRYISDADFMLHSIKNKFCSFQCLLTYLSHHAGQLELVHRL
jgi:hypothetical protein